jgi:hypothetical protein
MVKKQNVNNMILNFNGDDDIEEEEDGGAESERAPAATAAGPKKEESTNKVEKEESLKQKNNALYAVQKQGSSVSTSNQAGMTDESLMNEDDIPKRNNLEVAKKNRGMTYSGDLGDGQRAKRQPTKFNKKAPKDSDEDSDEDEDDEEEDEEKEEPRKEGS